MSEYTKYVAGLMFSWDYSQVALIKKNRPEKQKGKLNAIGGKIEKNEYAKDALIREFSEETDYFINNWAYICILKATDYEVHFYYTAGNLELLKTNTDEEVEICDISELFNYRSNLVQPLRTVISLVLDNEIEIGSNHILTVK